MRRTLNNVSHKEGLNEVELFHLKSEKSEGKAQVHCLHVCSECSKVKQGRFKSDIWKNSPEKCMDKCMYNAMELPKNNTSISTNSPTVIC